MKDDTLSNTPIYRKMALWHYALGAALHDPEYRKRLLAIASSMDGQAGEASDLIEALRVNDGKGVWTAMKCYWVEQQDNESVMDAILRKLEKDCWKESLRQTYNDLIRDIASERPVDGHIAALKGILDKYKG